MNDPFADPNTVDGLFDRLCELSGEDRRKYLELHVLQPEARARLERLLARYDEQVGRGAEGSGA